MLHLLSNLHLYQFQLSSCLIYRLSSLAHWISHISCLSPKKVIWFSFKMLVWQNFHLWQREDFGKSSPQHTHITLDKTVTNNQFRAPKIDQRQTTNREALIDENLPRIQERTVGVYGLLAQSGLHPHYPVQQTVMVALAVRLDWKTAASLQERVHLIWSRAGNPFPPLLSVKAANSVRN